MSEIEEQIGLLCALGQRLGARLPQECGGGTLVEMVAAAWLKVRDRNGALVPLQANKAQREFERRAGKRNVVLKARQMGLTTWIAAKFFVETITRPGTVTVQVAHDLRSVEEIFKIVHRFYANLPERLREGALVASRSNVRELVFPHLDSAYRVETAADPNAGRGLTIRNLHCSEVALWPRDVAGTLAALRAAVPAEGTVVLESTPKGAAGAFYEEWQRAEEMGAVRHFFPWWWEESYRAPWDLEETPSEREVELVEAHGLELEQLAYRRQLLAGFRGLAAQEFAEDADTCFLVSGECLFDVALVQERLRELGDSPRSATEDHGEGQGEGREEQQSAISNQEAASNQQSAISNQQGQEQGHEQGQGRGQERGQGHEQGQPRNSRMDTDRAGYPESVLPPFAQRTGEEWGTRREEQQSAISNQQGQEQGRSRISWRDTGQPAVGAKWVVWYPPVSGREYVVAVDPAGGGVEGDYSVAQVVERETGLQCAELRGHLSPRETAQQAAEMAKQFNGAVLVVERNNHGHEVLAYLQHEIGYERLWRDKGGAGWLTGLANRGPMLAEMEAWFSLYPERVNSRRLLEEMKTFVRKENGRAEAANGAHDDCVMAMAIALAARGRGEVRN